MAVAVGVGIWVGNGVAVAVGVRVGLGSPGLALTTFDKTYVVSLNSTHTLI